MGSHKQDNIILAEHDGYLEVDISTKTHKDAVMLIDVEDWDKLKDMNIGRARAIFHSNSQYPYVACYLNGKAESVHRLLFDNPKGLQIDHIEHKGLLTGFDNRRSNLRVVTSRGNQQNRSDGSSKYPGISFNKRDKRWQAHISIAGKKKHLGYFKDELKAAKAYRDAVHELDEEVVGEIKG